MTRKQVQTLNHRRRASQNLSYLCWILNPSKSTSKQAASDSDSSSDSPSSSSPEEGNQRQLTGPFILNQVTKIAHLTKTKEGKMLPSCGAKFFDEELYRVSGEISEDFDLCQHKGCMRE